MKIINKIQQWDSHYNVLFTMINNDDIIGQATIEYSDGFIKLQGIYIYPEYRENGYFNLLFNALLEYTKNEDKVYLFVRSDNFIIRKYKQAGFKFYKRKQINKIKYNWLIKEL